MFVDELIDADPIRFTREYFEIQSRIMVGFPSVLIFGTKMITASMKQLVVYEDYYIGKALEDCKYAGKGLSKKNITDDILETKHKDASHQISKLSRLQVLMKQINQSGFF